MEHSGKPGTGKPGDRRDVPQFLSRRTSEVLSCLVPLFKHLYSYIMPVKLPFPSQKSLKPFRLFALHTLYVHIGIPNNILFAHYSLPVALLSPRQIRSLFASTLQDCTYKQHCKLFHVEHSWNISQK